MKIIVSILLFVSVCVVAFDSFAQGTTYVNPYTRKDWTHVPGHYRTTPDSSTQNNWSTRGNTNPYTGEKGHTDPNRQRIPGSGMFYNPGYPQRLRGW